MVLCYAGPVVLFGASKGVWSRGYGFGAGRTSGFLVFSNVSPVLRDGGTRGVPLGSGPVDPPSCRSSLEVDLLRSVSF